MLGYKHILKSYAAQIGVNYNDLLKDYESETPDNKADFLYQIGGRLQQFPIMSGNRPVALINTPKGVKAVETIDDKTISMDDLFSKDSVKVVGSKAIRIPVNLKKKQQGGGEEQIMQIIEMFAQATNQDPKVIMQQLQQLPSEQQQQAIEQMAQQLQQSQQQDESEPVYNQQDMQIGGDGSYIYKDTYYPKEIKEKIKSIYGDYAKKYGAKDYLDDRIKKEIDDRENFELVKKYATFPKFYNKNWLNTIHSNIKELDNAEAVEVLHKINDITAKKKGLSIFDFFKVKPSTLSIGETYDIVKGFKDLKKHYTFKDGGSYDLESLMGYRDDSPFRYRPFNTINSNSIDMSDTGTPLYGLSDEGDLQYLEPYSGLYKFKGNSVTEFPAQSGVDINSLKLAYAKKLNLDINKLNHIKTAKDLYNLALMNNFRFKDDNFIKLIKETIDLEKKIGEQEDFKINIPKNDSPERKEWLDNWEKFLVNQGILDGDKNYSVDEIGNYIYDYVNTHRDQFKNVFKTNIPVTQAPAGTTPKDKPKIISSQKSNKTKKGYEPSINSDSWNNAWRESGLIPPTVWDGLTNKQKQDFVFDFADKDGNKQIDNSEIPNFSDKYNSRDKFVDGIIGKRTVQILPPPINRLPIYAEDYQENGLLKPIGPKQIDISIDKNKNSIADNFENELPTPKAGESLSTSSEKSKLKNFKFNFNNPFRSLANNVALTKAFSPAALPFLQQSRIKSTEIPLIDERAYIQQINDVFNPIKRNINANSTTGQAYLANLAGQEAKQVNDTLNDIAGKNQQIMAQNNANRVQAINQEFAGNEAARANYYDQYLQNSAARDAGINEVLNQIAQQKDREIAMNNSLNATLYNTPFLEDTTSDLDRLMGNRSIGLDPVKFQQMLVDKSKKEQDNIFDLDGKKYTIVDGKLKEIKAQTGLSKFIKRKLNAY
jgi:hypothetical protein